MPCGGADLAQYRNDLGAARDDARTMYGSDNTEGWN